ncbi:heme-copper oxidase subunit III [Natronosporangium hydrolyticum]|uniref:cytochrome-c oxidase n=1 Tax=Natronosporangium hydrolyticum TaxID=2811111 RepID=A0A895YJJ6_9ACTN|nr:heme-copper oxidase subunit III [Natronosporangium hydrolyticum]QSB16202.1 heme-copper oxidase subunit III [Natronosporangium hydrolyticum]
MTAAPALSQSQVHSLNRPNITSVGVIVWLASELMFFAGLFAMFFSIRAAAPELWAANHPNLNVWFALPFTTVLLLSSITCQIGVFRAERGDVHGLRRWFALTFVMGTIFVVGQLIEYVELSNNYGIRIDSDGFGSMFYLTTGFHLLHVVGGLLAFLIYLARTSLGRFTPAQATSAIVISYYWHFVDAVWIVLFAMIFFLP